jgi:outer membrane immunogenic protein
MIVAPAYSWTGFYLGLNGGGAWSNADIYYTPPGLPFTAVAPAYSAIGSGRIHPSGFIAGGQIGYNYQVSRFVVGAEGDLNAFNLRGSFANAGVPPGNATLTSAASVNTDWLATVRGRAGFTLTDKLLVYGTGGLAVSNLSSTASETYSGIGTANLNASSTRVGWTAGAGLEYAFLPNWSIKGEYLHLDLGQINATAPLVGATGTHVYDARLTADLARIGINYKFAPTPVVAKY